MANDNNHQQCDTLNQLLAAATTCFDNNSANCYSIVKMIERVVVSHVQVG